MELRERLYGDEYSSRRKQPKFKVGDAVKISREKGVFSKGYHPNYTMETFKIQTVKESDPPHYKIQDLNGEDIMGVFYEPELSLSRRQHGAGRSIKIHLWEKYI